MAMDEKILGEASKKKKMLHQRHRDAKTKAHLLSSGKKDTRESDIPKTGRRAREKKTRTLRQKCRMTRSVALQHPKHGDNAEKLNSLHTFVREEHF